MNQRLGQVLKYTGLATAALSVIGAIYVAWVVSQAPPVTALETATQSMPSVIMSSDGKQLGRVQQNRREPVTLEQISPWVIHALIDTEDHRFREHDGVDWLRTGMAILRTATGRTEGGSTITQQLARNVFPEEIGRSRNISRKIKEVVTARRIENLYSKDQILTAYLNSVPFLYNAVGIEAAARTYFDKPARELNPREAATLVGMLKGTYYFNPVQNPDRALERRNLVMRQMVRRGDMPQAMYDDLSDEPLQLKFKRLEDAPDAAPHFTAYVRKWLETWAEGTDHDLLRDGLVIHTTLDSRLQEAAAEAVETQAQALQLVADVEWSQQGMAMQSRSLDDYADAAKRAKAFDYFWRSKGGALLQEALRKTDEYRALRKAGNNDKAALAALHDDADVLQRVRASLTRLEAGLVAVDPTSGAVRAWVGSRDHEIEQYDHVAQAQRQPGSTFKPIVYATALQQGIPVSKIYSDTPVSIPLGNGKTWRPTDMSGSSGQPMTMWEGLVYSKNTITAQVMQEAGLDNVAQLARAMGITDSKLDKVLSMALGTSPVTLLEMATVYATIADEGRYRQPYVVERITDKDGKVLAEFGPQPPKQVLTTEVDNDLIDMMRGVVRQGTGTLVRSRYVPEGDLAGKTGTTQNNMDGWFMLMTPKLVTGAWVGFNDQRVTMRSSYWGQGGHSALLLVGDFMRRAVKNKWVDTKTAFAAPERPPVIGGTSWDEAPEEVIEGDGYMGDMAPADPASSDMPAMPAESGGLTADPAGVTPRPTLPAGGDTPRSAQELGDALRNMGRDPDTGAQVQRSPMSAEAPKATVP
ncbi:MAG: transglycosylase domain-containing protein [Aquabacterium sp.]|jgi:penicillin-binding protein 1A|uniref:penicillin-binding protein 1A n=1 Tax=Aquabacterium sp. TaxID=1872578 RepID=UPI003BAF2A8D